MDGIFIGILLLMGSVVAYFYKKCINEANRLKFDIFIYLSKEYGEEEALRMMSDSKRSIR